MFDISPIQIIIVLAIALLIFGPKRLPEMGRNLGKGMRDFKGGITGEEPTPPVQTTRGRRAAAAAAQPVVTAPVAAPTAEELITSAATPGD